MKLPTPIQQLCVRGHNVFIKRDDLHYLSGNKFRKLYWLTEHDVQFFKGNHILSYGGIQSNAMLAVAQLANLKHVPFTYFTRRIPNDFFERTKEMTTNFSLATKLGMEHVELNNEEYDALATTHEFSRIVPSDVPKWIGIPQGVAIPEAEIGIQVLAGELNEFAATLNHNVAVVLPCGTGTTAHYLAKHIHSDIPVYGVPCVGSREYLLQQIQKQSGSGEVPRSFHVLKPRKRVSFGRLWHPLYEMYRELHESTGIEIDLLYGCLAWHTLLDALDKDIFNGRKVIYIHCGGNTGNSSQLHRYEMLASR